jgi:hypothetical protein
MLTLLLVGMLTWTFAIQMAACACTNTITWNTKASMPTSRSFLFRGHAVLNQEIYVMGGWGDFILDQVEVYNVSQNTWRTVTPLPSPRVDGTVQVVNNRIYIIGGNSHGGGGAVATVWEYSPALDNYVSKMSMPTGRRSLASARVADKIYTISGVDTSNQISTAVEVYDPSSNTWTAKTPHPLPRQSLTAEAVNGKVYTFGGNDESDKVHEYDPITNAWTPKSPMPVYVSSPNSVVVDGKIYVVGGDNSKTVLMYDPVDDVWHGPLNDELPTPRAGATTAEVSGRIYVIGGCCPAPNYAVNEEGSITGPDVNECVNELKTEIEEFYADGEIDNQGIVKSLLAKLNTAQKLVDEGKTDEAKSILEDDFIPQVQNLSGIHITVEAADTLVESAEYIISNL